MVTIKAVNKALAAAGHVGVTLVRGEGYFYFVTPRWLYTDSVPTMHLQSNTVRGWVLEYELLLADPKNN